MLHSCGKPWEDVWYIPADTPMRRRPAGGSFSLARRAPNAIAMPGSMTVSSRISGRRLSKEYVSLLQYGRGSYGNTGDRTDTRSRRPIPQEQPIPTHPIGHRVRIAWRMPKRASISSPLETDAAAFSRLTHGSNGTMLPIRRKRDGIEHYEGKNGTPGPIHSFNLHSDRM